ncbi:MAG: cell wall-binding repeat-containing protein [Euzebya sp.]
MSYQTCTEVDAGCTGSVPFTFSGDGWDTFTLDLTDGQGNPWSGPIYALAITIGGSDQRTFEFDWMRLHEPGEVVDVSFSNPGLVGSAQLFWDVDADPSNNTPDNPGWGSLASTNGLSGSGAFDVGARRDVVVVASGDSFPDALAAGPTATALGGVLLLTNRDRASDATRRFITEGPLQVLRVAGGPAAVTSTAALALADAAGF